MSIDKNSTKIINQKTFHRFICDCCGKEIGWVRIDNNCFNWSYVFDETSLLDVPIVNFSYWEGDTKKFVCNECRETNSCCCDGCNEWYSKEEVSESDGGIFCENCVGHYHRCDHCDEFIHYDDLSRIYVSLTSQENWCECCLDNNYTFSCTCCGDLYLDDVEHYSTYDGFEICDSCSYDYYCCCECGQYVSENEVYTDDDDDYWCPNCRRHHNQTGYIHDYHRYQKNWMFRATAEQVAKFPNLYELRQKYLFSGREIEISGGGCNYQNAKQILDAFGVTEKEFRLSRDSSLQYGRGGFEMVSDPMTLADEDRINWAAGLNKAYDLNYRAHDSGDCGLHFHVDRLYFNNSKNNNYEYAFIILVNNNQEWMKKFSRRKYFGYCRFQSEKFYKCDCIDESGELTSVAKQTLRYVRSDYMGHGSALNFCNSNTVEVRFIRGTLKYSTMLAARQFVEILSWIVKHCTFEELFKINLDWFKKYAKHKHYDAFLNYCAEQKVA